MAVTNHPTSVLADHYVGREAARLRFLLIHGSADDIGGRYLRGVGSENVDLDVAVRKFEVHE